MTPAERDAALLHLYSIERRSGASPLEANEAMHFFAKRIDAEMRRVADDQFNRDLEILRQCMERTR